MTDPQDQTTSDPFTPDQPAAEQPTPELQGEHTEVKLQEAPKSARERGLDAVDVASQGSMITSDPPSSLMAEDEE